MRISHTKPQQHSRQQKLRGSPPSTRQPDRRINLPQNDIAKARALDAASPSGHLQVAALAYLQWDIGNYLTLLPLAEGSGVSGQAVVGATAAVVKWARRLGISVDRALLDYVRRSLVGLDRSLLALRLLDGDLQHAASDYAGASATFLEVAESADAWPLLRTTAIKRLGDAQFCASNLDAARTQYEEALERYRGHGLPLGEASTEFNLAELCLRRYELTSSQQILSRAKALYEQVGDGLGVANCSFLEAELAVALYDLDRARALALEAEQQYLELGAGLGVANARLRLADILQAAGDPDESRAMIERAEPILRTTGNVFGLAHVDEQRLVAAALASTTADAPLDGLTTITDAYDAIGDSLGAAYASVRRALVVCGRGTDPEDRLDELVANASRRLDELAGEDVRLECMVRLLPLMRRRTAASDPEDSPDLENLLERLSSPAEARIFRDAVADGAVLPLLRIPPARNFIIYSRLPDPLGS